MTTVYILLGSNLGDRAAQLAQARQLLAQQVGTVVRASSLYETAAWGVADQPDFYNQVLEIATTLAPEAVLDRILALEHQLGRVRFQRWHERTIDIDILYYGEEVMDTPRLQIPHPELQNRRFTLAPLAEIAPDWRHPVLEVTQAQLLAACTDPLPVRLVGEVGQQHNQS
ncbi:2-amino-4-hydroxy-6-hydroxymethyldihydropteridine diphosphokinase [Catalinimonas alkaloidigena]|uniref:2-amino-4-hydroxy-6- hydroxymethyldihydropteridine diphosphokinase n=1 Tax=Catalinimonas alkaloidigena TaxID=1075417 RepID=UPI001FDFCF98|nr:2-amino-4-hydroxy-6-hydroxymethyldihydropteridine diphosphokinase [Catalinimonas alkaloidigena]